MAIDPEDLKVLKRLTAPFAPEDIKHRPQGGRQLAYIDSRQVMNRLDAVVGPLGWEDVYHDTPGGVICSLSVTFPSGKTVTKRDAGACSGTQDEDDNLKGGFSDAFKRAAVKFGIGRHLYGVGVPPWHEDEPAQPAKRPAGSTPTHVQGPQQPAHQGGGQERPFDPKPPYDNSRAWYPYLMSLSKQYGQDFQAGYVNNFCDGMQIPRFTNKWTNQQARLIFDNLLTFISTQASYDGQLDPYLPKEEAAPASSPTNGQPAADDDIPF